MSREREAAGAPGRWQWGRQPWGTGGAGRRSPGVAALALAPLLAACRSRRGGSGPGRGGGTPVTGAGDGSCCSRCVQPAGREGAAADLPFAYLGLAAG